MVSSLPVWVVPAAIALHNLEEAVWLPAWSVHAGRFHSPVAAFPFRFAVLVLTLLAFGLGWWAASAGARSLGMTLLAAYALAMVVNVFLPHVAATVALRRYCPGLSTGILAVLPAGGWFVISSLRSGAVAPVALLVALAVGAPALVLSIPWLFRVGAALERRMRAA